MIVQLILCLAMGMISPPLATARLADMSLLPLIKLVSQIGMTALTAKDNSTPSARPRQTDTPPRTSQAKASTSKAKSSRRVASKIEGSKDQPDAMAHDATVLHGEVGSVGPRTRPAVATAALGSDSIASDVPTADAESATIESEEPMPHEETQESDPAESRSLDDHPHRFADDITMELPANDAQKEINLTDSTLSSVPRSFHQLNLSPEQHVAIQAINGRYADRLETLRSQLDELEINRDTELNRVLSRSQQRKLRELRRSSID